MRQEGRRSKQIRAKCKEERAEKGKGAFLVGIALVDE